MKEVLLIYPRLQPGKWGGYWDPPLGILYLAGYLQEQGIRCNVVDATFLDDWDIFENKLRKYSPDIVGVSFSSPIAHLGFKAVETVKKIWPDSFTVAGGPHPTVQSDQTMENKNIDAIVIGEGEIALTKLVMALSGKGDWGAVPGIQYRSNGRVVKNEAKEYIANLDDLPFPDREAIDFKRYIELTRCVPIHVSRGCPFNCLFCQPAQRMIFGPRVRTRSPGNVVAEMLALREQYPQKDYMFSFQADTFTMSGKWVLELCDRIIASNLHRIPWAADSRVNTINEAMIKAMKKAGCGIIRFGIESGSQKILDFLNKGIKLEQSRRVLGLCYKNNIIPQSYLMIGTPTETRQDVEMTRRFIRDNHPAYINISRTTPVPGSGLYEYIMKNQLSNVKTFSDYDYFHNEYPIKLEHLTKQDLDLYYRKMMNTWLRSLVTRPSLIFVFLKLLYRFPGYRLFLVRDTFKGFKIGTTGGFLRRLFSPLTNALRRRYGGGQKHLNTAKDDEENSQHRMPAQINTGR